MIVITEAERKRVLKGRFEWYVLDPKPDDLIMVRMNSAERRRKVRTVVSCKSLGRTVVRGKIPIESGDSWLSLKYI